MFGHRQDSSSRIGAIFDVDNTLIPGPSVEIRFFRYLLREGFLSRRLVWQSIWYQLQNICSFSLAPLREKKIYLLQKRPEGIEPLAKWFIRSEVIPKISLKGFEILQQHQNAGHHVILASGSPEFLITPIANFCQVSHVIAARLEVNRDGYTGRVYQPYPYGVGKQNLLESYAAARGIQLEASYGYGDSPGDVQILETVGHPVVVNPIRGMAKVARIHRWPVSIWA